MPSIIAALAVGLLVAAACFPLLRRIVKRWSFSYAADSFAQDYYEVFAADPLCDSCPMSEECPFYSKGAQCRYGKRFKGNFRGGFVPTSALLKAKIEEAR